MSLLKSDRRRQAEDLITQALELLDDAEEAVHHGQRVIREKAKSSTRAIKEEGRDVKRATKRTARRTQKGAVRVGGRIAGLVDENPVATIGAALALAVTLGAGVTYLNQR